LIQFIVLFGACATVKPVGKGKPPLHRFILKKCRGVSGFLYKNTHAFFFYQVLEQNIAELLIFCAAMCFSKEIDLRIIIAEHFGNARTGREINLLGFSRV
jgi:hypothetical protein